MCEHEVLQLGNLSTCRQWTIPKNNLQMTNTPAFFCGSASDEKETFMTETFCQKISMLVEYLHLMLESTKVEPLLHYNTEDIILGLNLHSSSFVSATLTKKKVFISLTPSPVFTFIENVQKCFLI